MKTLYERANEIMRGMVVSRHKMMNSTGWENATVADVAHLSIGDRDLVAALKAIEERLHDLEVDVARILVHTGLEPNE